MYPHTPPRRLATLAMALLLLGGTAACGSSSSDGASDEKATTTTSANSDDSSETTEATEDSVDDMTDDSEDTTDTTDTTESAPEPVSGDSRDDYVASLVSTFEDDGGAMYTKDQVQCLAENFVDTIGVDAFEQAGITAKAAADDGVMDQLKIDEPTAREMAASFDTCGVDLRKIFLDQIGTDDMTADQKACVEDVLTEEAIVESFVNDVTGNDTAKDPFDEVMSCVQSGTGG